MKTHAGRHAFLLAVLANIGMLLALESTEMYAAGGNSMVIADNGMGSETSLTLDADGNPVVVYLDTVTDTPKLLHCDDPNCSGGGEVMSALDTGAAGNTGSFSMVLDAEGNPVVSYNDGLADRLEILHCDDPNCATGGDAINAPNGVGNGIFTSIALDADGNPVVSYGLESDTGLRILHCNDPNCSGNDESITTPDNDPRGFDWTSLELDILGNPVVSYHDESLHNDLRVLHCDDPDCSGSNESITVPDSDNAGFTNSLELDALGNPVISYYSNGDLQVLHCNDANCVPGGDTISVPDSAGFVGGQSSLVLDGSGNPVVSYWDGTNGDLKVLHCGNPMCTSENIFSAPDTVGLVGFVSSLALDLSGNPVVAYSADGPGSYPRLKILHCLGSDCNPTDFDADGCKDDREQQPKLNASSGGGRNPKNVWDFFDTPDDSNVRDKSVAGTDFFRILQRFGATGDPMIDPLSSPPPVPAYHTAFDRGPSSGPNPWNLTAANGSIAGTDFFAMLVQFGHSCA